MADKTPGIDPMTVVIRTNNLGDIVGVHTALPIKVVKIDADGKGGELYTRPLTELVREAAVLAILDPYRHLTVLQREQIRDAALSALDEDIRNDGGYIRGVLRSYVEKLDVPDQLECISSNDDYQIVKVLGFVPETGEPFTEDEEDAADDEDYTENLVWVPALPQGEYHWLRQPADEPADRADPVRAATVACGAKVRFEVDRTDSVPAGERPYSHSGWCQGCLDAMAAYQAGGDPPKPKKPDRLRTLWWGQTNVGTERTYHAFLGEPQALPREKSTISKHFRIKKYVGNPVCGLSGVNVVGVTDMPLTEQPHPSEKSRLCLNCMDRVTRLRIDNQ